MVLAEMGRECWNQAARIEGREFMIKAFASALAFMAMALAAAPAAQAQAFDLGGPWRCRGACSVRNGPTWIEQRGGGLTFFNELRQPSRGYVADPFTVVATDWRLTGRISRGGDAILWSNGSRWVR
jgi:hypothetical protein